MALRSHQLSLNWKVLVILLVTYAQVVTSIWEYAICTKHNIIFYDKEWNEVAETASLKFEELKALTYDTTHDVFYFADSNRTGEYTKINTLKLNKDGSTKIKTLIQLTDADLTVDDLVYDFNDDALFYSDRSNKKIMRINFNRDDAENVKATRELFISTEDTPGGLELDACKRNLYFATDEPNINVISIKDKNAKSVSSNHHQPIAIARDELTGRIYIADKALNFYYINSFTSEGNDFKEELKSIDKYPKSLAVDHTYVYYLDSQAKTLQRIYKHANTTHSSSDFFMEFTSTPTDVIVRTNFIDAMKEGIVEKCDVTENRLKELKSVMSKIQNEAPACGVVQETSPIRQMQKKCLHGGKFDETSASCICNNLQYDGEFCEINLCHNFCLNSGECSMEKSSLTSDVTPTCSCTHGFTGTRCEHDACSNYCLNAGKCKIDKMKKASCECKKNFYGKRCETENKPVDTTTTTTSTPTTSTTTEDDSLLTVHAQDEDVHKSKCPVGMNLSYVLFAMCLALSLLFFLIILLVIRRFHKPMRPRIRKKFVVHKNIEPMTYRPTTEQCEVIIEDCCNMNICDTPCFDPKILQQEISENNIKVKLTTSKRCGGGSSKDDKQDLLKNMELNQ